MSTSQQPIAYLWVDPVTRQYHVDRCTHPLDELIPVYRAPPVQELETLRAENAEMLEMLEWVVELDFGNNYWGLSTKRTLADHPIAQKIVEFVEKKGEERK